MAKGVVAEVAVVLEVVVAVVDLEAASMVENLGVETTMDLGDHGEIIMIGEVEVVLEVVSVTKNHLSI